MGRFRYRAISVIFVAVFLLMIVNPPVENVLSSQTREVGIESKRAGDLTDYDYPIGNPTYVYGSSTSGSYTNTFVNDSSYHVSTSAQYDSTGTTSTLVKASSYDVEFGSLYNGSLSDTYTYNSVSQGFYDNGFGMMAFHYHFYFTNNTADQVTDLTWKLRGCATGGDVYNVRVDIFIYNFLYGSWYDWGDEFYESQGWINVTRSVYASQYISPGGEMRLRMTTPDYYPYAIYSFFDFIWWNVTYHTHAQRIDFDYLFHFTGAITTIKSLSWSADGKTNSSTANIWLCNHISSAWDDTGSSFTTTEATKGATVNYLYYMNDTGYMKIRLSQPSATSPFTVSVDYLAWIVVYSTISGSIYQSVITSTEPTYLYGSTYSGGYNKTLLIDDQYQVAQSASYFGGSGSSTKATTYWLDNTTTGTRTWSNPSYAQSSNDQRATAATSAAGKLEYSHYLWGRNFAFSIPDGSPITGILVQIEASKSATANTYAGDNIVRLLKGGVLVGSNKAANSYTTTDTTYNYGGSGQMWEITLTEAEVEAFGFGVAISCYVDSSEALGNAQAQIDYVSITVYYSLTRYRISYYYYFYFTDNERAKVGQLGWLLNGKTSSPTIPIYIYDWSTSSWYDTGMTLTTTQADKSVGSVNINKYMNENGTMILRFFKDSESAGFTVSMDFMKWDIVYEPKTDTTKPSIPNLFYPLEDQYVSDLPLLTWNESTDDSSGVSYYRVAVSTSSSFTSTVLNTTTIKTWYQFSTSLNFITYYWKVKAIDKSGNIGNWSSIRSFTPTSDPQVAIVFRNPNNPSLNEYMNPTQFNTTYHRSVQDGEGVWNALSPYFPIINIYTTEVVNITVRDWLGTYLVDNQQYSYDPTIVVDLNVFDVCVGNGADAMAYIILTSGSIVLHKFTYRSDIHWLVIPGIYNLTVIYPAVTEIQLYYNLSITGDYGIKVSSSTVADLYSASDNWAALTGNVADIVTKINNVNYLIYTYGMNQTLMNSNIKALDSAIQNLGDVSLNQKIALVAIVLAIVVPGILVYIQGRDRNRITRRYMRRLQSD